MLATSSPVARDQFFGEIFAAEICSCSCKTSSDGFHNAFVRGQRTENSAKLFDSGEHSNDFPLSKSGYFEPSEANAGFCAKLERNPDLGRRLAQIISPISHFRSVFLASLAMYKTDHLAGRISPAIFSTLRGWNLQLQSIFSWRPLLLSNHPHKRPLCK